MARHRDFQGQRGRDLEEERYYDDSFGRSVEDDEMPLTPESSKFYLPTRLQNEQNTSTPQLSDFLDDKAGDGSCEEEIEDNSSATTFHFDEDKPSPAVKSKIIRSKDRFSGTRRPENETVQNDSSSVESTHLAPTPPTSFKVPQPIKANSAKKTFGFEPPSRRPNAVTDFVGEVARLQIEEGVANRNRSTSPGFRERRKSMNLKDTVNLVIIGHVDAGKSTLMGHMLFKLGYVQNKTMHKYRQEAQKQGKGSFAFAWVLDESSEERNRGITMDIARTRFDTNNKTIVLLDAPGHKDFIPNMISGACQADCAVLVVNATKGEFETGFDAGGQTREHAILVRSLGVSQLAVAINKLDTVEWAQERFEEIKLKLQHFLRQAGFQSQAVTFVPVCGLGGDNLVETPEQGHALVSWYQGPTLLEVLDGFDSPTRGVDTALRFCIGDVFKGQSSSGLVVSGKVETGSIAQGDKVIIMPCAENAGVKGVQTDDGMEAGTAFAGDQCLLTLNGVNHPDNITIGNVLCHLNEPITPCTRFEVRVVLFNVRVPLTRGFPIVVHCHCVCEPANVHRLTAEINKSTGDVIKRKPRCLAKNSSGILEIVTEKPICVTKYSECKQLGRITIRAAGATIAAGVITDIKG